MTWPQQNPYSSQPPQGAPPPGPYPPQQHPQGYPAYGYPQPASAQTNTMAIVALVLAFLVPIAGVVCGHIAKRQILRTGQQGKGLATAALAVGYGYMGLAMLMICGGIGLSLIAESSTY